MNAALKVLIIDDDQVDRMSIVRALKRADREFQIEQVSCAADGFKLMQQIAFDVILLDYRLGEQNGLQVLKMMRSGQYDDVAVVMISRMEDEQLAEQCFEAGAQDFLLKDEVNSRRLTRVVRHAQQRYQMDKALKASRQQLLELSEHDPLTGLLNRRGFERALSNGVACAKRNCENLAVLLLDLDDFKTVNDTLGHDSGDQVLLQVAQRIAQTVRDNDYLCRLGGDEFVVLMTHFEHTEQVAAFAERIISIIQQPINVVQATQRITASLGIALFGECSDNAVELLKCADTAMYQAKKDGRNIYRFYSEALQVAVQLRSAMKNDLHLALANQQFELWYQPQMNARTGHLESIEALIRWHHPERGLVNPVDFIPIAEETGMIVDIGAWVLQQACCQLAQWRQVQPTLRMAVNVSAIQIRQENLQALVQGALSKFHLPAEALELEITESALIKEPERTAQLLEQLVVMGVSLSLDDFGTGYSSLEQLRLFPIKVLKIDRGFVCKIGAEAKHDNLLMAMIYFAKTVQLQVVAEGVETQAQAGFCAEHGVDLLQGYYYSKPLPAADFSHKYLRSEQT